MKLSSFVSPASFLISKPNQLFGLIAFAVCSSISFSTLNATPQSIAISNATELQNISASLAADYHLTADIDVSSLPDEFKPIGTDAAPFTGSFNGNGHKISNLEMNVDCCPTDPNSLEDWLDKENIGLFGVTDGATIQDVDLRNVSIYGESSVGALVGQCRQSVITNCSATGTVGGTQQVGGLIGFAGNSDLTNCWTSVTTDYCELITETEFGPWFMQSLWFGGLVGHVHPYRFPGRDASNTGDGCEIDGCFTLGYTYGSFGVGGLFGNFHGSTATGCISIGDVESKYSFTGGAAGYIQVEPGLAVKTPVPLSTLFVDVHHFVGNVTSTAFGWYQFGGDPSTAQPSVSSGIPIRFSNVITYPGAGGLVGYCEGGMDNSVSPEVPLSIIVNCSASCDVLNLEPRFNDTSAGGFIGFHETCSLISYCQSSGTVRAPAVGTCGGFVGWAQGFIENSTSSCTVEGVTQVGGFVGLADIDAGEIACDEGAYLGQFRGCTTNGDVYSLPVPSTNSMSSNRKFGGFVGDSVGGFNFEKCGSRGDVITTNSTYAGGFVGGVTSGTSSSTLEFKDCFALGNLQFFGTDTPASFGGFIGGRVGSVDTQISNSYCKGNVNVAGSSVGGFVGDGTGIAFSGCYWDESTSGQTGSQPIGVNGRTTAQMFQQATYVGWDFTDIWDIDENQSYPFLR